jgi:hypothetical protein
LVIKGLWSELVNAIEELVDGSGIVGGRSQGSESNQERGRGPSSLSGLKYKQDIYWQGNSKNRRTEKK